MNKEARRLSALAKELGVTRAALHEEVYAAAHQHALEAMDDLPEEPSDPDGQASVEALQLALRLRSSGRTAQVDFLLSRHGPDVVEDIIHDLSNNTA